MPYQYHSIGTKVPPHKYCSTNTVILQYRMYYTKSVLRYPLPSIMQFPLAQS